MTTTPKFVNRNTGQDAPAKQPDAMKILEHYAALNPNNKINTNSQLYKIAVKQYNSGLKNSSTRPAIPTWFCGKIDGATGELIVLTDDAEIRASKGFSTAINDPSVSPLTPLTGAYAVDNCLNKGTPGSYEYSQCAVSGTSVEENFEVSGIDWITQMATFTLPEEEEEESEEEEE